MADTVVGLEIRANSAAAEKSVGNIKKELRAAQQDAISLSREFGELSPQAMQAAKRVAELRDAVADTNERIKLFDPGAKFQVFSNVLNTAAGGFAALTGAAALFGAESEDLQKTLVKVQSALALSQGLSVIADAGKDFQRLGAIAKDALAGIRTGLAATGIGLFVVALGTIVAYWEDIKELVSGVNSETKKLNEAANENAAAEKAKTEQLGNQDNILKLQGKSEKEILQLKINQLTTDIKAQEVAIETGQQVQKQQIAAAERNQKLLKGFLDFIFLPIKQIVQLGTGAINGLIGLVNQIPGVDIDFKINGAIVDQTTDYLTKLIFDPEEVKAQGEAATAEAKAQLLKTQNDLAGLQLAQQGGGATGTTAKAKDDEALKNREAFLAAQRKLNRSSQENELDDFKEFEAQLQSEKDKQAKLDRAREIEAEKAAEEAVKKRREAEEAAKKLDEEIKAQKIANIQIVSSAIGGLADVVGRQTAAGKALAIAQATIDGFLGVQKALASAPPPFNFIAAAAVGIASIANIRKIVATKIPGQGGGGSVPSGLAVAAPSIPKPQQATTQLDQNSLNSIGNAVSRSFVVESDVSSGQERIRRLNRAARLN